MGTNKLCLEMFWQYNVFSKFSFNLLSNQENTGGLILAV